MPEKEALKDAPVLNSGGLAGHSAAHAIEQRSAVEGVRTMLPAGQRANRRSISHQ
jgi:hypothetical protein